MPLQENVRVRIKSTSNNIRAKIQDTPRVLVNQLAYPPLHLDDLLDVDLSTKQDGSLLIYNVQSEKFESSILLEKQNINGGHF